MKNKTAFETETCTRCHGSGHYSRCADYGTTCFRCAGAKVTLTKRGAAAQAFFSQSCQVPLSDLKLGDRIKVDGITERMQRYSWIGTVIELKRSEYESTYISGSNAERYHALIVTTHNEKYGRGSLQANDAMLVRIYRADDSQRLAAALEYQATLTKAGTPRKRDAE